jgi:hypothetical protein
MAGDQTASNINGAADHWLEAVQAGVGHTRLYKASATNLTGTDYFVWFFNTATGDASTSVAPVHVRLLPGNYSDTWDFGDGGKLFDAGLYVVIAVSLPASPLTTPTGAGSDKAILDLDIRIR